MTTARLWVAGCSPPPQPGLPPTSSLRPPLAEKPVPLFPKAAGELHAGLQQEQVLLGRMCSLFLLLLAPAFSVFIPFYVRAWWITARGAYF